LLPIGASSDADFYISLDEYAYVRFLRARKWDINLATRMLVDAMKWRTTFKPHGALFEPETRAYLCLTLKFSAITEFEVATEYKKAKVVMGGYDKLGRLLVYNRTRLHFGSSSDAELCKKLSVHLIEKGIKLAKPDSPYTTLVFDLTGFGLSNMVYFLAALVLTN